MNKCKDAIRCYLRHGFLFLFRFCSRRLILPCTRNFGFEQGTPLGRYYIDAFLKKHATRVHGRCLEFGEARYKDVFPNASDYTILSAFDGPDVDLVGDIHNPPTEWIDTFDSIICTQVFEHLQDPDIAATAIYRLLRAEGVLLLTVPFFNHVHGSPSDYFRYTDEGIRRVLERAGFTIEFIESGGNFLVSMGALMGFPSEVFSQTELDAKDKDYPYTILVLARKDAP